MTTIFFRILSKPKEMTFTFCSISMETKRRKAKWEECKWCKARGLSIVFRSGKRKCLEKHMVLCKTDYVLENEVASRTDSHAVVRTVALLSQQVAELQAQVRILMLKKDRYFIERDAFWSKLTLAWKRAKENTKRILTAYINSYKPVRWFKNRWEWLSAYYLSKTIELHDVLSFALWPVLESREHRTVLRGTDSSDHYHMFKRVWGKQELPNIRWFREAVVELGLPVDVFIDDGHLRKLDSEFQRTVMRYQATKKRNNSRYIPQGLVGLVKTWEKMYTSDEDIVKECTRLGPNEILTLKTEECLDPIPLESEEARAGSTSALDLQSDT
jgi:hypothetical protein